MAEFRPRLMRLLRIPPEPAAPEGAPGSLQVFRAARAFYGWSLFKWGVGQVSALVGLLMATAFLQSSWSHEWGARIPGGVRLRDLLTLAEVLGWLGFLVQLPVTWVIQRLEYELHWYLVTDRSLRIRSGIWVVEELTMTFANIQEMSVQQGPIERLLGISNLRVQSAGGGARAASGGSETGGQPHRSHVALFRGVADATAIRDLILAHLRECRSAGLGDPEVREVRLPSALGSPQAVVAAARELLEEVRALRHASTDPGQRTPPASG